MIIIYTIDTIDHIFWSYILIDIYRLIIKSGLDVPSPEKERQTGDRETERKERQTQTEFTPMS
jgi:hypothetical protein